MGGKVMAITTTLNDIRKHEPSIYSWEKLLKHLGKTKADDEPLKFSTILESNGVEDAYWCLQALPSEYGKQIRLLSADVAERVIYIYEREYPDCDKPRNAIQAARDYANGLISEEELSSASAAAEAAGDAAWDAAWYAAWYAASAARYAARYVARGATRAIAVAATQAAARYAARAAACDAEEKVQGELLVGYFG
jgi:hypothetical protein